LNQANQPAVSIRRLGLVDYRVCWRAMQAFTAARTPTTPDELWLVQHPPVYTLGLKLKLRPLPEAHGIPVVHSDRGGDVTYHGPGQLVVYVLMDLQRRRWGIKTMVQALEQAVIDLLQNHGVPAVRRPGAPGVYVNNKKIAALGLRVRQGRSYHGLALNADMDLKPFADIEPCGYPGLGITQLVDLGIYKDMESVQQALLDRLLHCLGYNAFVTTQFGPDLFPTSAHG
jgi:lipoyl(octanoyl) transferase